VASTFVGEKGQLPSAAGVEWMRCWLRYVKGGERANLRSAGGVADQEDRKAFVAVDVGRGISGRGGLVLVGKRQAGGREGGEEDIPHSVTREASLIPSVGDKTVAQKKKKKKREGCVRGDRRSGRKA